VALAAAGFASSACIAAQGGNEIKITRRNLNSYWKLTGQNVDGETTFHRKIRGQDVVLSATALQYRYALRTIL
jgi:hypothetical protein